MKREKREVLGEKREYLTIKILHNDMTVNVPADNAERVGLRKVIDEEAVKKVVKYLTSGGTEMPKNWNRRFKHNRDKMKTGDIFELAEVVRNLSLRDGEKGLSTGEKQMYVKAKKILASELMYAKHLSEDDAIAWLEDVLTAQERKPAARRRRPLWRRSRLRARRRRHAEEEDSGRRVAVPEGVWAVLVAAGRGERLGEDRPKAFARLGDLPLLAEPLRRLDECHWIDAIVVVAAAGWEEPAILLAEEIGASKVTACVPGGETRSASVRAGLAEVPEDVAVVLVHDAARPVVPPDARSRACSRRSARASTARCRPAGRRHREAGPRRRRRRDARPRRARLGADPAGLRRIRRPCRLGRRRLRLRLARRGRRRPGQGRRGRRAAAQGDDPRRPRARGRPRRRSPQVTTRHLPRCGSRSLRAVAELRVGIGVDAHALADGVPLVLGGVAIEHPRGLAGHSDGDVVAHALIDALLGAAGLGDIGALFPSGDESLRGSSSLALLAEAYRQVQAAGWRLVNADCVLVGEEPRIAPYREEMRSRLEEAIGEGEVNVRATTTDRLGFAGRGEGLAAHAVALLERS